MALNGMELRAEWNWYQDENFSFPISSSSNFFILLSSGDALKCCRQFNFFFSFFFALLLNLKSVSVTLTFFSVSLCVICFALDTSLNFDCVYLYMSVRIVCARFSYFIWQIFHMRQILVYNNKWQFSCHEQSIQLWYFLIRSWISHAHCDSMMAYNGA